MKKKQKRKHLESTYATKTMKMSRAKLDLQEDALQHRHKAVAPTQGQEAKKPEVPTIYILSSSSSTFNSSEAKLTGAEFCNTQEDARQSEPCVVVGPAWSQTAGEKSSALQYFSFLSSTCKFSSADEYGIHQLQENDSCLGLHQLPRPQHMEHWKICYPYTHNLFSSHWVNNSKPLIHSVDMKEEMDMKIYYTRVQVKRGVAVLWDAEEGLEPPEKKTRMEEMTFPEEINTKANLSDMSVKERLTDRESGLDHRAQEGKAEADSPAEPPALEGCVRPTSPEGLVAPDSGFKCMGCCRVFPSLGILQEHVKNGVNEGFSCHAFHVAFSLLRRKVKKNRRKAKKNKTERTFGCQKEKHCGMKTTWHK